MSIWRIWTEIAPMAYSVAFVVGYYVHLQGVVPSVHHWIGIALTFAGFTFWIIARVQLGRSFSINPYATQMMTKGLYSTFQHPIYYSQMLAFTGVAMFFWNSYVIASVIFLTFVNLYRMRKESTLLRNAFSAEYEHHTTRIWF